MTSGKSSTKYEIYHPLFKDATWTGCSTEVEGYKRSKNWRPVDGMYEIDERSVLKDNDVLKYVDSLPRYRSDNWAKLKVELY